MTLGLFEVRLERLTQLRVEAAFANFDSAFVSCFSASYESRSSSINAWWSVPASAMVDVSSRHVGSATP